MSKKLIKAVYYTRVSTNKEEQEQSFEAQEAYFKELLSKENGYELVAGYCEKGVSGTKLSKRPEFNRMLEDAGLRKVINKATPQEVRKKFISTDYVLTEKEPEFKMIFVKDNSRLARNTDIGGILKKLKDKGVYVYFCDLNRSNEHDSDDMLLNMLFSLAQQESVDKSTKVRFGALQSAKNGKIRCGNQLYGYTYNKEENSLRIIEKEANIVKLIYQLREQGNGTRKVCNYLKEQGVTTRSGVDFRPNVVSRMLQNPTYTGKLVRNKFDCNMIGETGGQKQKPREEWIIDDTDKVDKIIDEEVFEKVQELINENIDKLGGIKKGKYLSRSEFAEKIICGKCGKHYVRNSDKLADGSKKIFYNCATKKQKGVKVCDSRNISSEELEDKIKNNLSRGKYKELVNFHINIAIEFIKQDKAKLYKDDSHVEEIEKIKKQIENYKNMLNTLLDILFKDNSDSAMEVFNTKKSEIENHVRVLEDRLKELTLSDKEREAKEKFINDNMAILRQYAEAIPEEISREEFLKDHLVYFEVNRKGELGLFTHANRIVGEIQNILKGE
ncbi:recombinase family protein [Clostridium sp.]|uniref:recombinase family protein n=1 Tax=Clostridium sp. TaxID=1506 RepID=UPI00283BFBB3|nr:recombinase family protein [Clostridium sp.]MDR3594170.1 recombinase family protein [Clostridium sp.]